MGMWLFQKENQKDSLIMTSGNSGLKYIIKYGDQMRAGVDIGLSAVENNGKLSDRT